MDKPSFDSEIFCGECGSGMGTSYIGMEGYRCEHCFSLYMEKLNIGINKDDKYLWCIICGEDYRNPYRLEEKPIEYNFNYCKLHQPM